MLKRLKDVENLSDIVLVSGLSGYNIPRIKRVYPQMMSNATVSVIPTSQPQRTLFCSKVFVW